MKKEPNTIVILVDIRSAENVGSIFRTADALNVGGIVLGGITPDPTDKFNRPNTKIAKTALGAELSIPWTHCNSLPARFTRLKKAGYVLIAIEQDATSVDYKNVQNKFKKGPSNTSGQVKTVLVLGNEVDGLPKNILNKMDIIAHIPMYGVKESLNVSVAFGIAGYRILGL
jgi:23S rRNA (guanosine2251-2'-O)-methyltransferase